MKIEKTQRLTDPNTFALTIKFTGTITLDEIEYLDDESKFKIELSNRIALTPKPKSYLLIPSDEMKKWSDSDETVLCFNKTFFTSKGFKIAKSPTFYDEDRACTVTTYAIKDYDIDNINIEEILQIVVEHMKSESLKFLYTISIMPYCTDKDYEVKGMITIRASK